MSYFKNLENLPICDLYNEFQQLMNSKKIDWYQLKDGNKVADQICLNSIKGKEGDIHYGRGSLIYDWDNSYYDDRGNLIPPLREQTLKETDFTELCNQFKDTLFEEVYNALTADYNIGRVRIMNSRPKTCLTWHKDDTDRIHYPMKTQEGCLMIIQDEVKHLEKYSWYYTKTLVGHTAINSSKENRLHLVATVI